MALEIKVPSFGESISESTIAEWLKADGDLVAKGDTLVTLDTEKASSDLTAEAAGRLRVLVPAGTDVAIGAVIGQIEPAVDAPLADPEVVRPAPVAAPAEPVRAEEPTTETTPAPVTLATAHAAPPAPARVEVAAPPPPPTSITLVLPTGPPEARESRPEAGQDARVTRRPMSRLRKTLAKHLLAARHETAMLTTFNEVDMTEVQIGRAHV